MLNQVLFILATIGFVLLALKIGAGFPLFYVSLALFAAGHISFSPIVINRG